MAIRKELLKVSSANTISPSLRAVPCLSQGRHLPPSPPPHPLNPPPPLPLPLRTSPETSFGHIGQRALLYSLSFLSRAPPKINTSPLFLIFTIFPQYYSSPLPETNGLCFSFFLSFHLQFPATHINRASRSGGQRREKKRGGGVGVGRRELKNNFIILSDGGHALQRIIRTNAVRSASR